MASNVATKELTALDLIKGLSLFVMMTDHVGYYFFPKELWFRSFGRIDFPVWFFLPGYAKSRGIGRSWWPGAALLLAGSLAAGYSWLPLNAIVTIMVIRVCIDRLAAYMMSDKIRFWVAALLMAALFPVTRLFFEYGTLGLIIGMFGWLCRHRADRPDADKMCRPYGIFCWIAFSGLEQYMFNFDIPQFLFMSLGTGAYLVLLYLYRPMVFPNAEARVSWLPVAIVRFMGRHTLEIYVFHLLLFKAIRLYLHPELFMAFGLFKGAATSAKI